MTVTRRTFLGAAGACGALITLGHRWIGLASAGAASGWTEPVAETDPAIHVLNRVTWGVRPQDIEQIRSIGIDAYIDGQLQPESIPDPVVDAFVGARRILTMPPGELHQAASDQYETVLNTQLSARLFRAVYSERQLYERMVEFWTDHFNIPIGDLLAEKIIDDREVVRRHALGTFRDLLFASAQSAAMLYYLDNASSTAEHPNENYAREIMELHTLGVEGGYSETDVTEVARALTGWTVNDSVVSGFYFDSNIHDQDEKTILGTTLPAGRGIEDGLQVIDLLATHPATARFISFKLCRRFVADQPPESLVNSTAEVFVATGGDIRAIMRHILTSAEFMSASGQKFRRPFDFLVAALRVLSPGLQIQDYTGLVYATEPMGQIPFFWGPPNGYPDVAGAWISTNGLLHRWNIALDLVQAGNGYLEGAALDITVVVPPETTVGELIDSAAQHILERPLPEDERAMLGSYVTRSGDLDQAVTAELYFERLPGLIGLLIVSPYFQWI